MAKSFICAIFAIFALFVPILSTSRYHRLTPSTAAEGTSSTPRRHHRTQQQQHLLFDNSDEESSGGNCAAIPPALWCGCDQLETQCGSAALCSAYTRAVRNQPLHITLLYESLCPDCQQLITKSGGLFEVYQKFKQYIRVELVPYGNARMHQNETIVCQHGAEECRINKFQSCAIAFMHDPFPFIYCLESLIGEGVKLQKAAKKCYAKLHTIPHIYDQITHCFNGPRGDQLQMQAAQRTKDIWPDQHEFVPWILVNNASLQATQFLQAGLPTLICLSQVGLNGREIPECDAF